MAKKLIKFNGRSIATIANQTIKSIECAKKEPWGAEGWMDDIRAEVVNSCFLFCMLEHCKYFSYDSYDRRFSKMGVKIKPAKSNPVWRIWEKLDSLGMEKKVIMKGLPSYSVAEGVWLTLLPNEYKTDISTHWHHAYKDCEAFPCPRVTNEWTPEKWVEATEETCAQLEAAIRQWQEHDAEYKAEIDTVVSEIQKRNKISDVATTTNAAVISMRMTQGGFKVRHRDSRTYTDILVVLAEKPLTKALIARVRYAKMEEDLERLIAMARIAREMVAQGQTNFEVKNGNPWKFEDFKQFEV